MNFSDIRKLHQKKYRDTSGHFLVEGEHLILELQRAAQHSTLLQRSELYVTREHEHWQSPFVTHLISARQMAQISETRTPQGMVALVPLLPATAPTPADRAVYLFEIQDPGNLGTILRTLAWFGGFRCLLSPGSVDPYNAKAVRASMGALFHIGLEMDVEPANLAGRFPRIACLNTHGDAIQSPQFRNFDCYLFGNEARGLPRAAAWVADAYPFTIPGSRAPESLNLAASVNICAYELARPSLCK